MQENYEDAMSIVRALGKPDLFITFTCNPLWPDIQQELEHYEVYFFLDPYKLNQTAN